MLKEKWKNAKQFCKQHETEILVGALTLIGIGATGYGIYLLKKPIPIPEFVTKTSGLFNGALDSDPDTKVIEQLLTVESVSDFEYFGWGDRFTVGSLGEYGEELLKHANESGKQLTKDDILTGVLVMGKMKAVTNE